MRNYDLEDRTLFFAESCRDFVKKLEKTLPNIEYSKQLIRSSGSQAANYIEANESLSKKDFLHRVRICRKEAKESRLWLKLIDTKDNTIIHETREDLIQESTELLKIFHTIVRKTE